MGGGAERRRGERVLVNNEFAQFDASGQTYVSDLSEHGVFVHTDESVPIGTTIELRFTVLLDDPVVIQGLGTVRRVQENPRGLGVEFGPLSPVMVLRIHDVLSRQKPRSAERVPEQAPEPPKGVPTDRLQTGVFAARKAEQKDFDDAKTGVFAPLKVELGSDEDDEDVETLSSGEFETVDEETGPSPGGSGA